jgi:RNA polymerase sigma factor (TIGR02999 family)
LQEWRAGDERALDRMIPMVYAELRVIARRHLKRERPGHTLDTVGLVHEAYIHLVDQSAVDWQDRAHFYAIASRTMRRVLVWHARRRSAGKRVDGRLVTLDRQAGLAGEDGREGLDLLALDEALTELESIDARLCRVVECRYFGGLGVADTAAALGISAATVKRDWQAARAWLRVRLEEGDS